MRLAGRKRGDAEHPTAFISYAHTSEDWRRTVLRFTNALRKDGGIDAEMDLYSQVSHRRWSTYGPKQIETKDFTLIAIDKTFKRRWMGDEKPGVGAGVGRESAAIRAIFDRDQDEFYRRVKVVLLPGADRSDIPDDLECEFFKIRSFDLPGIELLVRNLRGRPEFEKPPLGKAPPLPTTPIEDREPDEEAEDDEAEVVGELKERLRETWDELGELASSSVPADEARREELFGEGGDLQGEIDHLERVRSENDLRRQAAWQGTALVVLAVVLFAVGVAITGWAFAAEDEPSRPPVTATARGVTLTAPSGWQLHGDLPGVDGLGIRSPIVLVPGARADDSAGGLSVVAGIGGATGSTLLPASYRERLGKGTRRSTVALGPLQAYRYRGLRTADGRPLTIFVAPTSVGTAIVACQMPSGEEVVAAAGLCSRIAGTLRLARGTPYPIGPSPAFGHTLRKQLGRLRERQQDGLAKMGTANQATAEAEAATAIAVAYNDAAHTLAVMPITPQSANGKAGIVIALRRLRSAYDHLARAAKKENVDGYATATETIAAGEKRALRRLTDLRALGYAVGKAD
jgi:hypothetical protein